MIYKDRKKTQRKLNKIIRDMNKNIANDNLWKGRFTGRQIYAEWYQFEDGSGGTLQAVIRVVDKKTLFYKDYPISVLKSSPFVQSKIWNIYNTFIVEDFNVWKNDIPKSDNIDWRTVEVKDYIWNDEWNIHKIYKAENYCNGVKKGNNV